MKLNNIGSNQTEIEVKRGRVLYSYSTPVAACLDGKYYRTEQKYSVTTSRHINAWVDLKAVETKPQSFFDNLV